MPHDFEVDIPDARLVLLASSNGAIAIEEIDNCVRRRGHCRHAHPEIYCARRGVITFYLMV